MNLDEQNILSKNAGEYCINRMGQYLDEQVMRSNTERRSFFAR